MTTLNVLLQRATHPQRKPFVRSTTFVGGKGPPPFGYFDETQDHLGAYFHALLGWEYSLDTEEFTEVASRPGFLGRMLITAQSGGFTVAPKTTGLGFGEHGVWTGTGLTAPWNFAATGGGLSLDGDFLFTAKVKVVSRATLDAFGINGFLLGTGPRTAFPVCPGFACGSNSPNWQLLYAVDESSSFSYADSGIPVRDQVWQRLQISRVAGAVRWFVNGELARLGGLEGIYYPARLFDARKHLEISRLKPGATGEGFAIDSFHLLARRSAL